MLAASMQEIISSDEHKDMFSNASTIEKLAFHRVSDENNVETANEIMRDTESALKKKANTICKDCTKADKESGKCKCNCDGACKSDCVCHKDDKKADASSVNSQMKIAYKNLIEASEALENCGFEKLATYSLQIVDRLVSEAKAKKDPAKAKEMKEKMEAMKKAKKEKEELAKKKKKEKDENDARDLKAKKEKMKAKEMAMKAKEKERVEKERADAKKKMKKIKEEDRKTQMKRM